MLRPSWKCSSCAFLNPAHAVLCVVCLSPPSIVNPGPMIPTFIPEIKMIAVHNGVLSLQITNIESMPEENLPDSFQEVCFQFVYRKLKTHEHDTNKDLDNVWRVRPILAGSCSYDGIFWFKLPVYLIDYNLEFYMQCRHIQRNEFMTPSQPQIANIASLLLNNTYKVDDEVHFRHADTFYATEGKIIECLDDNKFKIMYYEYNEEYQANGNETEDESDDDDHWVQKEVVVDRSRIYHQPTDIEGEVDLIDADQMERNLLLCRSDAESQQVFHALLESYNVASFNYCYQHYREESMLVHWKPMSYFVSKSIFDFLFEPEFHYKVDCLLDGDNHHTLNLSNLRQSDIRTKLALQRQKIGKVEIDSDTFSEVQYSCDFCLTGMTEWHFMYQCSTSPICRHDFCVNCVNFTIELNKELRSYVDSILNEDLNDDCIHVIVSYVVGNVVCVNY